MTDTAAVRVVRADTADLKAYEELCREAVELGATFLSCGGQVGPTMSMWENPEDKYCRYFVNSPAVFKFAEAGVVKGVYPADHVAANIELIAGKSELLAKYGLKGTWNGLEPMWLPESFYERHPELRGPRVDHPDRSLTHRYAPCIDREEILEAYRLGVRAICAAAPALEMFEFYTNDAGAGICWCEFLYPGRNGPDHCKDRPMGDRLGGFFQAFHDGAKAAGREVTVLLRPKHFSDAETDDYLAKLPARTGMNYRIFPTQFHNPFMLGYCLRADWVGTMQRNRRPVFVQFPAQGASLGVRGGTPCPFLLLETLAEFDRHSVAGISLLGPTGMHWTNRALMKAHPAGLGCQAERWAAVERLSAERFGTRLAAAVTGFFRDVDMAVRIWPCRSNRMLFNSSLAARRVLFEPLMRSPGDVPIGPDEPWHQGQIHIGTDGERVSLFWDGSLTPPASATAMGYLTVDFNLALEHLDRAVADLTAAAGGEMPDELAEEIDRVEMFRCLLATLAHKVQMEGTWRRIEELESRRRAEGTEALANARRAVEGTIGKACDNTRRLIALLEKRPGCLAWADLEEARTETGGAVERLNHKLELMESALAE